MSLQLAGFVWRSSWGLGSCGSTTRRTSSSPVRLLRPAQTIHLKPIKGDNASVLLAPVTVLGVEAMAGVTSRELHSGY
ncbi:hypothetical protein Taro_043490, partial [Colocasia esculenta]|nr:hypothetical protein [Colocasia esculenta]